SSRPGGLPGDARVQHHVMPIEGRRLRPCPIVLGLVILASFGCSSAPNAPSAPPSVDVTGTWAGSWSLAGGIGGAYMLRLQQTGSKVTGEVVVPGSAATSGPLEGSVVDNELSFRMLNGSSGCELTVTGNE